MSEAGNQKQGDPRVAGIATVGWVTLAALGICIPITAIAGAYNGFAALAIPLAVIGGAGVLAMRVWSSGEKTASRKEGEKLEQRIEELEARLTNLEMIDSMEAHFAGKHRSPAPSQQTPTTMGPPPDQLES